MFQSKVRYQNKRLKNHMVRLIFLKELANADVYLQAPLFLPYT